MPDNPFTTMKNSNDTHKPVVHKASHAKPESAPSGPTVTDSPLPTAPVEDKQGAEPPEVETPTPPTTEEANKSIHLEPIDLPWAYYHRPNLTDIRTDAGVVIPTTPIAPESLVQMRPYIEGEDMKGVEVSAEDSNLFTLKGGFIARDSKDHNRLWYVSKSTWERGFEPILNVAGLR